MLPDLPDYERFVYTLQQRYSFIRQSTLAVIRHGATFAELNRVPAPGLGFDHPNLPFLIEELVL